MDLSLSNRYLGKIVNGTYRIDRLVGHGSFAWVYHAYRRDGFEVAVKVLHSTEPTAGVRFAREIQVLKALPTSPNLVRYVDHGRMDDGWPQLVLEYVDGISLKEGMARCQTLAPGKAVAFLSELCEAFVGLHQLGVAHRDVKPENILMARQGGIKLIDFGLIRDAQGILKLLEQNDPLEIRIFSEELDQSILVGTPEYMAPEQFSDAAMDDMEQSHTDTWSDVYSLGVILFQLLSGWKLFPMQEVSPEAYPTEILRYMQWRIELEDSELPACPGIDMALESILLKALHRDPRMRQPDARTLLEDLLCYLDTGQGVIEADEPRTYVVSFKQLMKLQAERDARANDAPPEPAQASSHSHRVLPPIGEEEEEDETVTTASHSVFDDDDGPNQGHTVIFFANEDQTASRDIDTTSDDLRPYSHEPGNGGRTDSALTFEHPSVDSVTRTDDDDFNPWQELTPTNPRSSLSVAQMLVELDPDVAEDDFDESPETEIWKSGPSGIDIFGTIDAPPPMLDDLDDDSFDEQEVTNKVHISDVMGSDTSRQPVLLDDDTKKVDLGQLMPDDGDE